MADQIKTVAEMFRDIEQEIQDVKDGKLLLDTARVIQRGRALQLKTAGLALQYQRINKAQRVKDRDYNLLTGTAIDTTERENRPS